MKLFKYFILNVFLQKPVNLMASRCGSVAWGASGPRPKMLKWEKKIDGTTSQEIIITLASKTKNVLSIPSVFIESFNFFLLVDFMPLDVCVRYF